MNNIIILQNEIKNLIDKVSADIHATDDEKIMALYMALTTVYEVKTTRNAYATKFVEKEEKADGNLDEKR